MKIFNYFCQSCQHGFEAYVKTADQQVPCEKCNGATEKRLTMPTFILTGVGCFSNGTYAKAKDGPVLDKELLAMDNISLNRELGLPDDCP